MTDLIGDILSTIKFKAAVYFKYGFCRPWGMEVPKGDFSQFHLVTGGRCWLKIEGEGIPLEKGDIVIFPNGHPHQVKDHEDGVCRSGREVVTEVLNGQQPFSGETIATHLVCGHYEMNRELTHPIFEDLPDYIIIKSNDYGRFDMIYTLFELIAEEMEQKRPGYETIALRFAEILFVSVIRHYYLNQSTRTTNLLKDQVIYKVVDFIHRELKSNLNIKTLARHGGLSRTIFIERFKQAIGDTPLRYIKNWRMVKAKKLLIETDYSLLRIGEEIGYPSVSSFNRVFKQTYQISPGKFRQSRRQISKAD